MKIRERTGFKKHKKHFEANLWRQIWRAQLQLGPNWNAVTWTRPSWSWALQIKSYIAVVGDPGIARNAACKSLLLP